MCGSKKGSQQAAQDTAAEQAKQEAAAAEAKAAAAAEAAAKQAKAIEAARADAIATYKAEQEAKRQAEADKIVSSANIRQERIEKFGSVSTTGRASRRSGSRSRRSLITGLGGGIGYYDRFAS
jgi:predicted  nucleic acid-binding Zn-ribbon protein